MAFYRYDGEEPWHGIYPGQVCDIDPAPVAEHWTACDEDGTPTESHDDEQDASSEGSADAPASSDTAPSSSDDNSSSASSSDATEAPVDSAPPPSPATVPQAPIAGSSPSAPATSSSAPAFTTPNVAGSGA